MTLTLDHDRHEIVQGDARARLTPGEWRVVRHLLSQPGKLMSRESLVQVVWPDPHREPEWGMDVIKVVVCRTRKRLREAGLTCRIVTVHGGGYRLDV